MKLRKNEVKKEKFEMVSSASKDPLAFQLPTVIVAGAKKCGTKALMRFFGHHPQVIMGKAEGNNLFFLAVFIYSRTKGFSD